MRRNPTRYQRARAKVRKLVTTVPSRDVRAFFRVWNALDIEYPELEADADYDDLTEFTIEAVTKAIGHDPMTVDMMTHKARGFYYDHKGLFPSIANPYEGLRLSLALEGSTQARLSLVNGRYSDVNFDLNRLLPKPKDKPARSNPTRYRRAKQEFKGRLDPMDPKDFRAFVSVMSDLDVEYPEEHKDLTFDDLCDYIARSVREGVGSSIDASDLMTPRAEVWFLANDKYLPTLSVREGLLASLALAGSSDAYNRLIRGNYQDVNEAFEATLPKPRSR